MTVKIKFTLLHHKIEQTTIEMNRKKDRHLCNSYPIITLSTQKIQKCPFLYIMFVSKVSNFGHFEGFLMLLKLAYSFGFCRKGHPVSGIMQEPHRPPHKAR
jgi:hypothetical protein